MTLIKNLPSVEYGDYNLKDISKRISIANQIKNDPEVYQYYDLEGDESAEAIAQDFYGDASLYWLVYLMNDIVDPFYGWLLSNDELDSFVESKYGAQYGFTFVGLTNETKLGGTTDSYLVAARVNDTDGIIDGVIPLTSRGVMYTDAVISVGDKSYVEYKLTNIDTNINATFLGLEVSGAEQPQTNTGQVGDQLGLRPDGATYIEGSFSSSGGVSYSIGDIIGLAIDYTTGTSVTVNVYKNNVYQKNFTITIADTSIQFRPAFCLGTQLDIGQSGSIYTHRSNQTYSEPDGFIALEGYVTSQVDAEHHKELVPLADYIISNPPANGDHAWDMGSPALNRYFFQGSSYQHADLETAIPITVGDTIEFTYESNVSIASNEFMVHSSTAASNLATFGSASNSSVLIVGFTATLDGVPIVDGEYLPSSGGTAISDYKQHRIVLTATVDTDVKHFASDGTGDVGGSGAAGGGRSRSGLYDIIVNTGGNSYSWPSHTYNSGTQAEAGGLNNNLLLNNHQLSRWLTWPYEADTGSSSVDSAYSGLRGNDPNSGDNMSLFQDSLRADGKGHSTGFLNTVEYYTISSNATENRSNYWPYQNGFTIECKVKYNGYANSGGRACGVINANTNSFNNSMWLLGFDNFQDAGNTTLPVPFFSVLKRNTIYSNNTNYSNNVADIRSPDEAVIGQTYHLMGTIRPSDNTVEFWVDGISQGTATIADPDAYFIPNGAGNSEDILQGIYPTALAVGPRYLNGSWKNGQDCQVQDIKIHFREADTSFVQAQAASVDAQISYVPSQTISNAEYETDINDAKRKVKIIRPDSLRDIKNIVRNAIRSTR